MIITAFALAVNLIAFPAAGLAEMPVLQTGRAYILMTSHDAERYAKMRIEGTMIYIEGCFTDDKIVDFYTNSATTGVLKESLSVNNNGTFSGYYGGVPVTSPAYAVIKFQSGKQCAYRIDYDENGWFFSVNGLDEYTYDNVVNYMEVSDETSAYYVCADLDVARTRETLDEVRRIAFDVTDGIADDYQKAKALSEWVSANIYYDYDARDTDVQLENVTVENVLKTKRTVCTGYANLYAALLEAAGIKAVNIQGGVVSEGKCSYEELSTKTVKHEWVAFFYEKGNRWVYTDPVWDSGSYYRSGKFTDGNLPMKYFDIDGLALSLDHRGDKAELRRYMNANDYVQNRADSGPYTEPDETGVPDSPDSAETSASPETRAYDPPEIAQKEDYILENNDEDGNETLLIIAIALLSLGVIAAAAVVVKQMKGK